MKTKIVPALADDWVVVNQSYNTNDGMGIQSNKLNQEVRDIPLRRFLSFCKMNNVTQIGDKIQGNFIIGSDRSLYDEKTYNTWLTKYQKRVENVVRVNNAKPGHVYQTICGLSVIYLGFKYEAKFKDEHGNLGLGTKSYTQIKKVHYIQTRVDFEENRPHYGVVPKGKYTFTRDMGLALDQDELDRIFKSYWYDNNHYVYFADVPLKNPEYGYVEVQPFSYTLNSGDIRQYTVLFTFYQGKYYQVNTSDNTLISPAIEYDADLNLIKRHYTSYRISRVHIVPEKLFRIGAINA